MIRVIEVTKENEEKYIDQIAALEVEVLENNRKRRNKAWLDFHNAQLLIKSDFTRQTNIEHLPIIYYNCRAAYELTKTRDEDWKICSSLKEIEKVLQTLTPREEKVIRLRFGLEDGKSRTLEEVGQMFGVTRERIRQIEAKALRKLRHPSRSRKLKDYMVE